MITRFFFYYNPLMVTEQAQVSRYTFGNAHPKTGDKDQVKNSICEALRNCKDHQGLHFP